MNKAAFALVLALGFYSGSLRAQDTTLSPPTPPFVKAPPPGSTWQVKIEPVETAKPKKADTAAANTSVKPPKEPEKPVLLTVKTGLNGVTQGQVTYNDGRQLTYYVAEGSVLLLAENTGKAFSRPLRLSEDDACSLEVAHFPGTSWISQANYKGTVVKDGVPCWHYVLFLSSAMNFEAWIRGDTSYPIEVDVKAVSGAYRYHFEPVTPVSEDVVLPDVDREALVQLKTLKSALDALQKANAAQK